jgi:hypothetical protein
MIARRPGLDCGLDERKCLVAHRERELQVALATCNIQRCLASDCNQGIGSSLQKSEHKIGAAALAGHVQRREMSGSVQPLSQLVMLGLNCNILDIQLRRECLTDHVSTQTGEKADGRENTKLCGTNNGREPHFRDRIQVGATPHEQLDHLALVAPRGKHQRRALGFVSRLNVNPSVQQHRCYLNVASPGGERDDGMTFVVKGTEAADVIVNNPSDNFGMLACDSTVWSGIACAR